MVRLEPGFLQFFKDYTRFVFLEAFEELNPGVLRVRAQVSRDGQDMHVNQAMRSRCS